MTGEEAIKEINKAFEPAFANYIIIALTEGATASDFAENKPKTGQINYCPNCGAKMESEVEE